MEANQENVKPTLSHEKVKELVKKYYDLDVIKIKEFVGYDDCNFYCEIKCENDKIKQTNFKVTNHVDTSIENLLESSNHLALYLFENKINVPVPLKNLNGNYIERISLNDQNKKNAIRLFSYIPGTLLENVSLTPELLEDSACEIAKLGKVLANYRNEIYEKRLFLWSLENVLEIKKYVHAIKDKTKISLIENILDRFDKKVLSRKDKFAKSIIHGDLNTFNLLVENNILTGILDLGDTHLSLRIFDIAIFCAYTMIKKNDTSLDALDIPKIILKKYAKEMNITKEELEIVQICIMARISQSLALGIYFYQFNPTNTYLLKSTYNGWTILERLNKEKLVLV